MPDPIKKALVALDPTPWIVSLTDEERGSYAAMIEAETEWIAALRRAGCQVVKPERRDPFTGDIKRTRRAIVVVPADVPLPDYGKLQAAVAGWKGIVESAAARQGKEDTVGIRGATVPVWIGPEGIDPTIMQGRPAYVAAKITHHLQAAYRGVALTPEDALEVLRDRLKRTQKALAHSRKHSKHDRIPDQEERIEQIDAAVIQLLAYITQNRAVSVRMHSGHSWRIAIRTQDGRSIASTVATVALIPGTAETVLAEAHKRQHQADAGTEVTHLPGGLEVIIRRI